MVTQSSQAHDLPEWFVVQAYHLPDLLDWNFRCAVRCKDGDVVVLDFPIEELIAPGRSKRLLWTRREMLERMHTAVTIELARLSLED